MIRRLLDRIFGIDARSLAAFRVAVGAVLLVDFWIRGQSILEHYSDAGMFTRKQWTDATAGSWEWSLHAMNGEPGFQRMLFAIGAAAAAMLLVGWKTRAAAVISWVLLASLQIRNEYVINGGDILLRVLLFWAMFLPLGARWSLDRLLARGAPALEPRSALPMRVLSVGAVCIVVQFLLMYICSGVYKLNEIWSSGDAMRRSLHVDLYVRPLGIALRDQEAMLTLVSRVVPWVEIVLPALCLLPVLTNWWRGLAIAVFLLLHAGIELTLTTGFFSWVCLAGWLLFVPSAWWDVITRRSVSATPGVSTGTPVASSSAAAAPPPRNAINHLGDGLLLFLLAYVVAWNISGLCEHFTREPVLNESQQWLGQLTTLKQKWDMFNDPPLDTGWYQVTGTTAAGKEIDLLAGGAAASSLEPPATSITDLYIDHRWRKYMASVATDAFRSHRSRLALAFAARWNRTHGLEEQIEWIEVAYVRQTTARPGEDPPAVRRVVMHKGPVTER